MASMFEGEGCDQQTTSESGYNNDSGALQCEAYAMCCDCYTQQECPHSHISIHHQEVLNLSEFGMEMAPIVYLGHDPPLSSFGGLNEYNNQGQQPASLPSIPSPSWFSRVNKLVSLASPAASVGQHAPYLAEFSGLPGLERLSMTPSNDDVLFSQDVHRVPDLTSEPVATVSPRALEKHPAAYYTHLHAGSRSQREHSPSSLSDCSSSSSSSGDNDEEEEDMDDDKDTEIEAGNDDNYDEEEMPLMLTRPPIQNVTNTPSFLALQGRPPRFTSEALYHEALYGAGMPADPDSSRAALNKQVLPIVAAKHGHPVWPLDTKEKRYTYLLEAKKLGASYRDIKEFGEIPDAESTLRGRYRMLTKSANERVRRPVWEPQDIQLLRLAVQKYGDGRQPRRHRVIRRVSVSSCEDATELRISWKRVAEYIARNGGSYKFGYSTCRKKWDELNEQI